MYIDRHIPIHDPLDPLPSLNTGREVSKEELLQNTKDITRGFYDVDLLRGLDDFEVVQDLWIGSDFSITGGMMGGVKSYRISSRCYYSDLVVIETLLSRVQHEHLKSRAVKNRVRITTTNTEYFETIGGSDFATLFLPFESIGYDPSCHHDDYVFERDSSVGTVISQALTHMVSRMPYTPSQEVPAMIGQVTDLVRDLILGNRTYMNHANINRARRLAIDAYIENNLHLLTVSAAKHLIKEFNITRPTLYRMFEADGGVEAYVNRRRLHRTLLSLKDADPKRGAVRKIAEGFGFVDAGNFTRAFRSEFGFCPSEIVGQRSAAR